MTFIALSVVALGQSSDDVRPAHPFHANIINKEYDVNICMNLYDNDVIIPGQEVFGPMAGYIVKSKTTFYWFITSATINEATNEATLHITNDYGSEDLTALLTCENDSCYSLKQLKGSTLKVPKDGKWQKLPKFLTFIRKK